MGGGGITQVQFKELIKAMMTGDASDVKDLNIVKSRILDPASGDSFTPCKKPQYSDGWDFPEINMLPTLEEVPRKLTSRHCKPMWPGNGGMWCLWMKH